MNYFQLIRGKNRNTNKMETAFLDLHLARTYYLKLKFRTIYQWNNKANLWNLQAPRKLLSTIWICFNGSGRPICGCKKHIYFANSLT